MSLNPIQFGEDVLSQFTRYLLTYFPIADKRIEEQVRRRVLAPATGERMLVKGPYIQLNRPFAEGPRLADLLADPDLQLHPALPGVFRPIEDLRKHQELALRAITGGKHTVVATGTGSGRTEAFLLPVIDHCLKLRDAQAEAGVAWCWLRLICVNLPAIEEDNRIEEKAFVRCSTSYTRSYPAGYSMRWPRLCGTCRPQSCRSNRAWRTSPCG